MGVLAKMASEIPKFDLAFTVVEIVSVSTGDKTTIKIIDSRYSMRGVVVKTIELFSFDGESAPLYNYYVGKYLELAKRVEIAVRSGKF